MIAFWTLQRARFLRELRAHERFVRKLERDTMMSGKQRRRRLHGAVRERDLARARLRLVELLAAHRAPVPAELGKAVALARHFDKSARAAARSGDMSTARDWSQRCRETLHGAWLTWCEWNAHAKKPAEAGSVKNACDENQLANQA